MVAGTGSPSGPATVTGSSSPPRAACTVAMRPSAPSDIGNVRTSVPGAVVSHPRAMAAATSTALKAPEKAPGLRRSRIDAAVGLTAGRRAARAAVRSEEHTSELQSRGHLVCRLLLENKN